MSLLPILLMTLNNSCVILKTFPVKVTTFQSISHLFCIMEPVFVLDMRNGEIRTFSKD